MKNKANQQLDILLNIPINFCCERLQPLSLHSQLVNNAVSSYLQFIPRNYLKRKIEGGFLLLLSHFISQRHKELLVRERPLGQSSLCPRGLSPHCQCSSLQCATLSWESNRLSGV